MNNPFTLERTAATIQPHEHEAVANLCTYCRHPRQHHPYGKALVRCCNPDCLMYAVWRNRRG